MELPEIEVYILKLIESSTRVEAKLNNGLTEDLKEIKRTVQGLAESFQSYKDGRELSCPVRKDLDAMRSGRKDKIALVISAGAVIVATLSVVLGNVL